MFQLQFEGLLVLVSVCFSSQKLSRSIESRPIAFARRVSSHNINSEFIAHKRARVVYFLFHGKYNQRGDLSAFYYA